MSAFLLKMATGDEQFATIMGLKTKTRVDSASGTTISGEGVFTGSLAEQTVRERALAGSSDEYQLSFETGERLRGNFIVTGLEYVGDQYGERRYLLALDGGAA